MTADIKAKQLFDKCFQFVNDCGSPYPEIHAKEMAVICCDFASDYAMTREDLKELRDIKIEIEKP